MTVPDEVVLDQGSHQDQDGSSLVVRGNTLVLTVQHCDDYDAALASEPQRKAWIDDALGRACVSGVRLDALEVHLRPDYAGELRRQWLVDLLASRLEGLRSLYWGSDWAECFVDVPNLRALLEVCPGLTQLRLQSAWHENNAELRTAGLHHLGLSTLSVEALETLDGLELSEIQHLELWLYNHENEGADLLMIDDLQPLFQSALPALRTLTLHACELGPELLKALPDARFFPRLDTLGLLDCTIEGSYLDASCADMLLSTRYDSIASIDVTGSFCEPDRDPAHLLDRLLEQSSGRIRNTPQ